MLRFVIVAVLLALTVAQAQESYLDDRSSPEALVRSLYNAINRGEYARAYSYFSEPPAPDVDSYAQGFRGTQRVDLIVGSPWSEGTTGGSSYDLPVAIRALATDGSEQVLAGCYSLRMTNPSLQTSGFSPLHIVQGNLGPSNLPLEQALPQRCGQDTTKLAMQNSEIERVEALFFATAAERCDFGSRLASAQDLLMQRFELSYQEPRSGGEGGAMRRAQLFRFFCSQAAYNVGHVYFLLFDDGTVTPLHFSVPKYELRYVGNDFLAELESLTVTGFGTAVELVNSDFDPDGQTIVEHAKWRSLGDAYTAATWVFDQGRFSLVHYEVDAVYDGEITPVTLLDYR